MKIRNIIFDCNGTMIFDGKYHDIAWRTYVSKLAGRELTKEEFQHQILGHTNRDIFEWLLGKGALSEEKIMQLTEEKEVLYRSMYQDSPSGVKAAVAANAACIVGIYGDSDKKLLQNTGVCDYLIEDYTRNYIGYIERNLLE